MGLGEGSDQIRKLEDFSKSLALMCFGLIWFSGFLKLRCCFEGSTERIEDLLAYNSTLIAGKYLRNTATLTLNHLIDLVM